MILTATMATVKKEFDAANCGAQCMEVQRERRRAGPSGRLFCCARLRRSARRGEARRREKVVGLAARSLAELEEVGHAVGRAARAEPQRPAATEEEAVID